MPLKKFEPLILLIAMVLPTIVTWIYFVSLKQSAASVQQTAYSVGKTIQFALPVIWIWLCCGESLTTLLPWRRGNLKSERDVSPSPNPKPFPALAYGLGFGFFVAISVFIGFYFIVTPLGLADQLVGQVNDKVSGMGLDSPLKFLFLGVFYAIVHSYMEEYYWRWFVFRRLLSYTNFTVALIVSSLGFMAHHVILMATFLGWDSPLAYLISFTVAIGGMVWAWLYYHSEKLVSSWISHMIVDAAIFALGYVLVFGV